MTNGVQATITINHRTKFDAGFQIRLSARAVATGKSNRTERLDWVVTHPEQFNRAVHRYVPRIDVPETADAAFDTLMELYNRGRDAVISKAFDQFVACIGSNDLRVLFVFMAEINLALCREPFDEQRVRVGIEKLKYHNSKGGDSGIAYSLGNAYLAVREVEQAKSQFRRLLMEGVEIDDLMRAQVLKNLGSTFEEDGDHVEARKCYKQALDLEPNLMEAQYALGMSFQKDGELEQAIIHFDQVLWSSDNPSASIGARGHRLNAYFALGQIDRAFQEIASLLEHSDKHDWILPWCGRFVYDHARHCGESVAAAQTFWETFVRKRPNDIFAREERLKLLAYSKMHSQPVKLEFKQYSSQVDTLIADAKGKIDAGNLFDRVGHWAPCRFVFRFESLQKLVFVWGVLT